MSESGQGVKMHEESLRYAEKFDYFVAAGAGTFAAFMLQNFKAEPLRWSPATLELVGMVLLCTAVLAGIKRIERFVVYYQLVARSVKEAEEHRGLGKMLRLQQGVNFEVDGVNMPREKAEELLALHKKNRDESGHHASLAGLAARRWFAVRDYSLLSAFAVLLAAKIWKAYLLT